MMEQTDGALVTQVHSLLDRQLRVSPPEGVSTQGRRKLPLVIQI